ncbi:YoaK family protein [Salinicola aestuarinus]|uniref:YoaK family protein n=1 Tax=Salinicola aestuarinus TaxID=1949082 RepID=UPI000DA1C501|nr:YoaK family protein [Salinicola aestuarinus]
MAFKPIPIQAFALLFVVAGATDALIYRHSRDLLAVYMTGNTSHVGQHLATQDWLGALPLLAVIATFFGATVAAAWIGNRVGPWRATCVMLITAGLIGVAAPIAINDGYSLATVLWIAAGMGALNQVSAKESGVTFLTGTLVRTGRALAAGDWLAGRDGLMRWVALVVGAAIATLLDEWIAERSLLFIVAALLLGAALTAWNALAHRQTARLHAIATASAADSHAGC